MPITSLSATLPIVPQPPAPGLYVTVGPHGLIDWALEWMTKSLAYPSHILWVDGANAFNAYMVAITARTVQKDPASVLKSYHVARPFTAYQLETMVSEKLLPVSRRLSLLVSVISDPLPLFTDAEGRDTQIRQCYNRFILGLKTAAKETAILVLSSTESVYYAKPLLDAATRTTRLTLDHHKPVLSLI